MNRRKLITFAAILGVGALLIVVLGNVAGRFMAEAHIERLEVVWPSFMTMPERDRAFLIGLSMTCQLQRVPIQREAVLACLDAATRDPEVILPVGEDKGAASGRLRLLLEAASGKRNEETAVHRA